MFAHLESLKMRYDQLTRDLMDPGVMARPQAFQEKARQQAELEEVVRCFEEFRETTRHLAQAREMMGTEKDPELVALARQDALQLEAKEAGLKEALKKFLIPKDPNDGKNVFLEIRAGTGGDEASLFAGDLLKMYTRFAERQGWKAEMESAHFSEVGGFKEVILMVRGKGAYSLLKHEGGVHRVQRVPSTEANGRIHTSTATVMVMPEIEVKDIVLEEKDLRWDIFCASGPGGQGVNTTYSAVRVTHLPTGIVVSMQDERKQLKNREKAYKILAARVAAFERGKQETELALDRKTQVKSADRSEKIRTYNFPQNRVTDHRTGLSIHELEEVLGGGLMPFIRQMQEKEQAEKLAALAPV